MLDDDIAYETACLFEPMGAGVHGVESAEVAGKTVLVSGCGPIGLTAVSACKTFGAKLVIACDLVDERLETAREMGADVVINSGKCQLQEEVLRLTDGVGVDAAIDITGAGAAIQASLRCVRAAGKLVCVGLPSRNVEPVSYTHLTPWYGTIGTPTKPLINLQKKEIKAKTKQYD